MGKTTIDITNPLRKEAWEEQLFRETLNEIYFGKFTSDKRDSIVYRQRKLEKMQGDKVTFGLRQRLTGAGVTDDQILEGNEEALSTHDFSLELTQYRHAVRDKGEIHRKRPMYSIDDESRMAIKDWGVEKLDQLHFDAAFDTSTSIFYTSSTPAYLRTAVDATAKSAITVADSKLSLNFLTFIKTWAKTGGERTINPIEPVKINGKDHYVYLTHPDALYDLKTSTAWQQAAREAEVRGKENPLFSGAAAIWEGVVIHEHENCPIGTNAGAGANVPFSKGVLMGKAALCHASGKAGELIIEDFDYKNQKGYAWNMICKIAKPTFNSQNYGSVGVYVSRTNVSGA